MKAIGSRAANAGIDWNPSSRKNKKKRTTWILYYIKSIDTQGKAKQLKAKVTLLRLELKGALLLFWLMQTV